MWRSVAAVGGGFVGMMVAVMTGTAAAAAALVPGGLASMSQGPVGGGEAPRGYLVANLAVSFAAAALGGWIAGRFAPSAPFVHAGTLAAIVLGLGLVTAAGGAAPGQPVWYPWVIAALGFAGVLAGAALAPSR